MSLTTGLNGELQNKLLGGGMMGALIRANDWSETPLGSLNTWPDALRHSLQTCLNLPNVSAVHWGADLLTFYNDPYSLVLANRHPLTLGLPFWEVWPDIWHVLGPQIDIVRNTGIGYSTEQQVLQMMRDGKLIDTYWIYSFAPIFDDGRVAGIFVTAVDTTEKVNAERQIVAIQERQNRMLRQIPGFVGILSAPDFQYTYVNDAFLVLSEQTDLAGRRFGDAFETVVDARGFIDAFETAVQGSETVVTRGLEMRKRDGQEPQYIDFVIEPICGPDGTIAEVFVGGYETTEVYSSSKVLRANEAKLNFLDHLGAETAPVDNADTVLEVTTRLLGEYLQLSVCAYADMDEDENGFTIRGDWAAPGSKSIVGHYSLADFGKLAVKNLSAGLPLVVNDNLVELAPEEAATFQNIGIAATICMPLVKNGRLTALMAIHDKVPRNWTDEELNLLREVTSRSWSHVERVATVAALGESEERLRLAVENAEIGFWDVDVINDVLIWPPLTKAMFGISPDAPVTMADFYTGLHPEDRDAISAAFAAAADPLQRELYDVEYRTIGRTDQVIRWVAAKGRGVFDSDGRCLRVVGTAIEITERKLIEAALQSSEAELRQSDEQLRLLNADLERQVIERTQARGVAWQVTPDLMGALNIDGYFETSNPAWKKILGWSEAEVFSMSVWELIHPGDLERTEAAFKLMKRGKPAINFINRLCCKDRSYRWLSWVAVPEEGVAYCTGRDITVERAKEIELAERTAEVNRLWQNSNDLLVAADVDGTLTAVNKAWTTLLGWEEQELLGTTFMEITHPDDLEATLVAFASILERPLIVPYEYRLLHKDGSWRWFSWTAAFENGTVYANGRDVTTIRAAADELALTQDALRQAQKMEAMGQLTGGVAHDFNNLLTPIIGSLDLLIRRDVGSERERRLIDGAMQSAERAKTLVQRLLAFARRQPLQSVAVDLPVLVNGMAELLGSTLGPTVDVQVSMENDLPPALADPNQLEMALLNLSVNAKDAMPNGGTLTISVWQTVRSSILPAGLQADDYICLSISDTGTGMDEATRKRAIEPFFSTKGVGKGTGLGLSMAHGLAAQLSGALTIDSKLGEGTAVILWLPISTRSAKVADVLSPSLPTQSAQGLALLVDDEDLVRMSTADMLIDLGFKVIEAVSAEEALELIRDGAMPDLLVTDHLMPGMSGVDLANAVYQLKPGLPVLVISGYAEMEGIAPNLPRLTKPFRNVDLAASLAALLHEIAV